jgi:MerR family transcriptional regulator, light-induced transcriptional regulator
MGRLYRISVVAQMVGLSEPLLRAWERRHGLVKPRRTPGGYRAYTAEDVELLRRVKQLTEQGVSIAEAAQHAPRLRLEIARDHPPPPAPTAGGPLAAPERTTAWITALVDCARTFDGERAHAVLDEALAALPPVEVFDRVVVPTQVEVGTLWHHGEITAAGEHLVTQVVRTRLLSMLIGRRTRGARHVVCASLPGDDHDVGLLGAALRFRDAGWLVTYLGPRTPADSLARLVEKRRPDVVALAAQLDRGADALARDLAEVVDALPRGTRLVVGGAAARAHPEAVRALGAEVLDAKAHWQALLGAATA